jgi:signal recognition particle subunit SRP54
MHQEMSTAMKRLQKLGGFGKLAAMFGGGGGLGGAGGDMPDLGGLGGAGGGLPGLGGSAPFNLPPGFDKFSKK